MQHVKSFQNAGLIDRMIGCGKAGLAVAAVVGSLSALPRDVHAQSLDLSEFTEPRAEDVLIMHRLPATAEELTFQGERQVREWPVFLRGDEALQIRRLNLDVLSAVSVMPEQSRMIVEINDQRVGEFVLEASDDPRRFAVDIPQGLMGVGYNSVRVVVNQKHRVDCSIPATYELWTTISPATSGLVAANAAAQSTPQVINDIAALSAIPVDASGRPAFRIVIPSGASAASLDRALHVAQVVAAHGGYDAPDVKIAARNADDGGFRIVAGTRRELAAAGYVVDGPKMISPGVTMFAEPRVQRLTLLVFGDNRGALDNNIAQFEELLRSQTPEGTPAGLRALTAKRGFVVEAGKSIRLADAGIRSQVFDGRLLNMDFRVRLPEDFFSADYGSARMALRINELRELAQGSRLRIAVNGAVLASTKLQQGAFSDVNVVNIPLRGLSPGRNDVTIGIETAVAEDAECDVAARNYANRLSVDAEGSSMTFDTFARAGVVPNLTATHLLRGSADDRVSPLWIQVPRNDIKAVEAAAELVVASAGASGRAIPVAFRLGGQAIGAQAGLIVAPESQLTGMAASLVQSAKAQSAVGSPSAGSFERALSSSELSGTLNGIVSRVASQLRKGGFAFGSEGVDEAFAEFAPEDLLFAQGSQTVTEHERFAAFIGLPINQDVWTVVTASSSHSLETGVDSLLNNDRLNWLSGDTSIYKAATNRVVSARLNRPVYLSSATDPREFGNTRLVVAGLVSQHIYSFTGAMVVLALVVGFAFLGIMKLSGRRS